ncbi:helicase-exonuclease AddAB subunit AddA [Salinicoccus siamensis]|uniref:DNA 3'-5' helicase n=1 Tax=Salinicoccus siamensis TaxID=381830 RepID=A0ABV5Z4A7_9STAP
MVQWTDRQLEAIEYEGSDVLVAAAAGSGKTTVLVERIIRKVLSGKYSIDEVFVATFTNMSARDMKDKIEAALQAAYHDKRDPAIYAEILKLKEAHIKTLHSFCLHLIQMHYNAIGLPPDMRTLGDVEMKIRLEQAISNVLETYYKKADPDFNQLAMMLSSDKSNDGLQNTIRDLYHTAVASPDPRGYLEENLDRYQDEGYLGGILASHNHDVRLKLAALYPDIERLFEHYRTAVHTSIKETQVRDAFDGLETLEKSVRQAMETNRNGDPVELPPYMLKDGRSAFIRNIEDEDEKKRLLDVQNRIKKRYQEIRELPAYTFSLVKEELSPLNGMRNTLIEIALEVLERFQSEKRARNEMDFSDYEHYALAILGAEDGDIRRRYRAQFKEVMIDEYQDVNRVQEAIIQSLKSGDEQDGNLFMVGDVKQSIYKFRQADPSLFIEKAERFKNPGSGRLISLNHNFRSRREVIDVTNDVFGRIMDKEVGEVDYDETHRLVQGNYLDAPPLASECHIIENAEGAGSDAEILHIAEIVRKLRKKGVDYQDIVILTRNTRDNEAYRKLLSAAELPVFVNNRSGYLDTLEIRTMISLLSIIDNPLQDDHLVGVMRLPMFDFSEDDIAEIRARSDEDYLYEAVLTYEGSAVVMKKIGILSEALEMFRSHARYMSVPELIDEIYAELNILEYFAGMRGGLTRRANLNGFIEKAMEFEKMSHLSLYDFIAYIHRMIQDGQDFGEENTVSDGDDTLRVMTIHASKGLEFGYVIYAGLHRQLNMMDLSRKAAVHPDAGIAFKRYMPKHQAVLPSIHSEVLRRMVRRERISEEMRLVYVALTRAVHQLIIPLVYKDERKDKFSYEGGMVHADDRLAIQNIRDLLAPVLDQIPSQTLEMAEIGEIKEVRQSREHITLDDIEQLKTNENQLLKERILYRYPDRAATHTVYKESVTEIKRRNETPPDDSAVIRHDRTPNLRAPNFRSSSMEAPVFGTMMHELMMHLLNRYDEISGLDKAEEGPLEDFMLDMIRVHTEEDPLITDTHRDKMMINMKRFMSDDDMRQLLDDSLEIYTETPFIMNQAAIGYSDFSSQMVQGIVDVLLEMEEGYVIIDYKTDRLRPGDEVDDLIDRYRTQMDIYRRSIMQALSKNVTVYLYFFEYGAVKIDD